jgi:cytochrome c556
MFRGFIVLLSGACVGLAALGAPQENSAALSGADAIAIRQATLDMSSITFRSMDSAMKAGREAKTQGYPATALAKWAKALPRMFPPGTSKDEASANTRALAAIWQDRNGFDQAAANYATATARLAALADANDTQAFTRQLEEVYQTCRSCHSRYKEGDQGR